MLKLFIQLIQLFTQQYIFSYPDKTEASARFGLEAEDDDNTDEGEEEGTDEGEEEKEGEEDEEKAEDEGEEDNIYLSDKVVVDQKEYERLCNKIKAEVGEKEFEELQKHDSLFRKILLKQHNLDKSERSANEKHQINAQTRKDNERIAKALEEEREKIKSQWEELNKTKEKIEKEKAEIEQKLKEIETEIDDEPDDTRRYELIVDKKNLREKLKSIEEDRIPQLEEARKKLDIEQKINYYLFCENDAVSNIPELRLSNPSLDFQTILDQEEKGTYRGSIEDLIRAEVFQKIWIDYINKSVEYRKNNSISDFYFKRKSLYNLPPVSSPNKRKDNNNNSYARNYGRVNAPIPEGGMSAPHFTGDVKYTKREREMRRLATERLSSYTEDE